MGRILSRATLYATTVLWVAAPAIAQRALGPEFQVNSYTTSFQLKPEVAMASDGTALVIWENYRPVAPTVSDISIAAQAFDQAGRPAGSELRVDGGSTFSWQLDVAPAANHFVVAWSENNPPLRGIAGRLIDPSGAFLSAPLSLQPAASMEVLGGPHLAGDRNGSFSASWTRSSWGPNSELLVQEFDANALPVMDPALASSPSAVNDLARSQGHTLVALNKPQDSVDDHWDVFGRLLDPETHEFGPEFSINSHTTDFQGDQAVAADGLGNFIVVWQSDGQDGAGRGIYGQRFDADGGRLGREFRVNAVTSSSEVDPAIAADAAGNFVVTWDAYEAERGGNAIRGRVFRPNGLPAGNEFAVTELSQGAHSVHSAVALADNGTFMVAWQGLTPNDAVVDIFARRFALVPPLADHACVVRSGLWRCDTGRNGGDAETTFRFGAQIGDVPLLGDLDGDGRDEACVYRNGRLLCDSAHDGGRPEVVIQFGGPGDVPLLGDVDGNGRDEICVRRNGRFRCDTRHNGGTAEWVRRYGATGGQALLGDLDGDGTDDPCVYSARRLSCAAPSGTSNVTFTFGRSGDLLFLGDLDNDGRDDPCVRRGHEILCDTAHDGGDPELTLRLGDSEGLTLAGSVDGDG